jgi:hypothetical protein
METTKKEIFIGKTWLPTTIRTAHLTEGGTAKTAKITGVRLTKKLLASMEFLAG